MLKIYLAIPLLFCALTSYAARPFVTDDARLTTGGSCQLESWARLYKRSAEFWALPACNPTGNFEVTLGASVAKEDGFASTNDFVMQAKTLFRPLETNGWGIGFSVGSVTHPDVNPGPNQFGNYYAYVPISISYLDDDVVVHINVGALHDKANDLNSATWGIGAEYRYKPQLLLISEMYGDSRNNPYIQMGMRYSVIPNLFQIDSTIGVKYQGHYDDSWLSVGVRYTPDALLSRFF